MLKMAGLKGGSCTFAKAVRQKQKESWQGEWKGRAQSTPHARELWDGSQSHSGNF